MKNVFCVLKEIPEYKKVVLIIFILLFPVFTVCLYGIVIGGSPEELECIICFILFSLVFSLLVGLFLFGRRFLKKEIRSTKIYVWVLIFIIILHFGYYSSINTTFAKNDEIKYEVEIISVLYNDYYRYSYSRKPKSAGVFFIGSDGKEQYVFYDYYYPETEDNIFPYENGKMLIKEMKGVFYSL